MDPINSSTTGDRFVGEGYAGTDAFAGGGLDQGLGLSADPSLESPDATAADLTQLPNSGSANSFDSYSSTQQSEEAMSGSDQNGEQSGGITKQASQKAEVGMQKSAEGLKKAAEKARSASEERSGAVSTIGTQAADVLEKSAGYLEQGDTGQFVEDLEALVRRRPMESLLVAAGMGFIVSKAMR
jgi:ElaB/YqjD/DUF883 family membrane-anchored ribosome-binding protein